jgi:hypothetical protein
VKIQLLIFLWCFHFVSGVLYVLFVTFAAIVFRARIIAVNIGFPPRPLKFKVWNTPVAVGLLPSSSSVSLLEESNRDDHPEITADWKNLSDLATWKQVCLILGGPIAYLIVALTTLPFDDFVHCAAVGVQRLFAGAVQPFTIGQQLLESFVNVLKTSLLRASGILATVFLVWNLIPYFPSPAYRALLVIASRLFGFRLPTSMNLLVAIPLMLPFLVPFIGWCIAITVYLLN